MLAIQTNLMWKCMYPQVSISAKFCFKISVISVVHKKKTLFDVVHVMKSYLCVKNIW